MNNTIPNPQQLCLPPPCASYAFLTDATRRAVIPYRATDEELLAVLKEIERAREYLWRCHWYAHHDRVFDNLTLLEERIKGFVFSDWRNRMLHRIEEKHLRKVRAAIRRAEKRQEKECAA